MLWDWRGKTRRPLKGLFFPWGLSGSAAAHLSRVFVNGVPWEKHRLVAAVLAAGTTFSPRRSCKLQSSCSPVPPAATLPGSSREPTLPCLPSENPGGLRLQPCQVQNAAEHPGGGEGDARLSLAQDGRDAGADVVEKVTHGVGAPGCVLARGELVERWPEPAAESMDLAGPFGLGLAGIAWGAAFWGAGICRGRHQLCEGGCAARAVGFGEEPGYASGLGVLCWRLASSIPFPTPPSPPLFSQGPEVHAGVAAEHL